jgi:hypothetical protein
MERYKNKKINLLILLFYKIFKTKIKIENFLP